MTSGLKRYQESRQRDARARSPYRQRAQATTARLDAADGHADGLPQTAQPRSQDVILVPRYYDFNAHSKRIEKLRYMHRHR